MHEECLLDAWALKPQMLTCHCFAMCIAVWQIVEALDSTLLERSQQHISSSSFFTVSLDEASAIGKVSFLCVHLHILRDWVRVPIFLELSEVSLAATYVFEVVHPRECPQLACIPENASSFNAHSSINVQSQCTCRSRTVPLLPMCLPWSETRCSEFQACP